MEGMLDITPDALPDYYLVMTGPRATTMTSRDEARLWYVDYVFLFNGPTLVTRLRDRGIKIGVATSVANEMWENAEINPEGASKEYTLSDEQKQILGLFGSQAEMDPR